MALLIDLKSPEWLPDEDLRLELLQLYPQAEIRVAADRGPLDEIEMLAVSGYLPGEALQYPNLKLIQKTGAGVNNILDDKSLPASIQLARLQTTTSADQMAEYALAFVLQEQRHLRLYQQQQTRSQWISYPPRLTAETTVAILGLGRVGLVVAQRFLANGFRVNGWSRNAKQLDSVECFHGNDGLAGAIQHADYVVSILPSTEETKGLFNQAMLSQFMPSAFFINLGRGDQVNEGELIGALDQDLLAGAVLDVMSVEPLPGNSELWLHPKVQLTPHISGYHLGDAIVDIVENYRRLRNHQPLLNLVDRALGY